MTPRAFRSQQQKTGHVKLRMRHIMTRLVIRNESTKDYKRNLCVKEITLYLLNKNFESSPSSFHTVRMLILLLMHTAGHYNEIYIKSWNERVQ